MKRNVFILTIVLLIIAGLSAFAQNVEYVNVDETENEIEAKKAENQELLQKVVDIRAENAQLADDIHHYNTLIARVSEVIHTMDYLLRSMEAIKSRTNNEEYKAEMDGLISENKSKMETLNDKRIQIHEQVVTKETEVDVNNTEIRSTNAIIENNKNRIFYLELSVKKTKDMNEKLAEYNQKIEGLIKLIDAELQDME